MDKRILTRLAAIAALSVAGSGLEVAAAPNSHFVGMGSGFDFTSIQAAIDASTSGDTIIVSPGVYPGTIDFLEKDIFLRSTAPTDAAIREATILQPPTAINASTNGSLEGFRINGGIRFGNNSFPTIGASFSPQISNNHIVTEGTAIDIRVGYQQAPPTPVVENNLIRAHRGVYTFVQAFGGGMNGVIRNNTFIGTGQSDNGYGIMNRMHQELPVVSNNTITNFQFGILFTYDSRFDERLALINHNNLHANGTNYWRSEGLLDWDRTGLQGNISVDPLFVNPAAGDYRLLRDSPLIDAGWDSGASSDINGLPRPFDLPGVDNNGGLLQMDIGAFEFVVPEPTSGMLMALLLAWLGINQRRTC